MNGLRHSSALVKGDQLELAWVRNKRHNNTIEQELQVRHLGQRNIQRVTASADPKRWVHAACFIPNHDGLAWRRVRKSGAVHC